MRRATTTRLRRSNGGGTMSVVNSENSANKNISDQAMTTKTDDDDVVPAEHQDEVVEEEEDDDNVNNGYTFEGVTYSTYQEMVNAKRKRNQQVLVDSGLLEAGGVHQRNKKKNKAPSSQDAAARKRKSLNTTEETTERRKSNRLAGLDSDGKFIEDERGGRFLVSTLDGDGKVRTASTVDSSMNHGAETVEFYRDRINDGSSLSVKQAVENIGTKWLNDKSVSNAETFVRTVLSPQVNNTLPIVPTLRPPSTESSIDRILALEVDDEDLVAKVTPDRIYGIATHPTRDKLIVCAGDKGGHVGIWDVDKGPESDNNPGNATHLFRVHKGAACCLQWTDSGAALVSASYDGTVRCFDVASEKVDEVFATYDSQSMFADKLGFGLDSGHKFWTQYVCLDRRYNSEKCFFVSTSVGTVMHIDLRLPEAGRITFHEELSEKKINTVSLHPNGYSLLTAGLDCTVSVWDLRKFQDSRNGKNHHSPVALASYNCGKSVNSAFFSPSGRSVVTTTMANKLDLFENLHQATTSKAPKPMTSIRHDNMTGRWLSTFMANWHPEEDIFVVGSMERPRCVEVFDDHGRCLHTVSGSALTAVASRCCFHPSTSKLTIVGGNSSGRVTIIR